MHHRGEHTTLPFFESTITLPTLAISTVYHVGTLAGVPDDRGHSFEADCLSVSRCPSAWRQIARIGGPTWLLRNDDGRFIDVRRLSRRLRHDLERWAAACGYLETRRIYRAIVTRDDATGEPGYSWFESREQAEEEALEGERIRAVITTAATPKLLAARNTRRPHYERDALDLIAMTWAAASGLDGLWWTENLDPLALSAPRGGIVASSLHNWTATQVGDVHDESADVPAPAFQQYALFPGRSP